MEPWQEAAAHFLQHETQFQLGMLPTEQAHPRTRGLADHETHARLAAEGRPGGGGIRRRSRGPLNACGQARR